MILVYHNKKKQKQRRIKHKTVHSPDTKPSFSANHGESMQKKISFLSSESMLEKFKKLKMPGHSKAQMGPRQANIFKPNITAQRKAAIIVRPRC